MEIVKIKLCLTNFMAHPAFWVIFKYLTFFSTSVFLQGDACSLQPRWIETYLALKGYS